MGLLNYSTKIPALRTAGEVQGILAKHGAKAIMIQYDNEGRPEALTFNIKHDQQDLSYRLPITPAKALKVLEAQHQRGQLRHSQPKPDYEQAGKVAWRIIKDWVEAQMAILETEMVSMEEVFLPYMLGKEGKTLYQVMSERGFYLPEGRG